MKRAKLSEEERVAQKAEYGRAWRLQNVEKLKAWRADNRDHMRARLCQRAAAQWEPLLVAGFEPKQPGRPTTDPEAPEDKTKPPKRGGEAYMVYQREYQKTFRAKRREGGWKTAACGPIPPEFASILTLSRVGDVRSPDEKPVGQNVLYK